MREAIAVSAGALLLSIVFGFVPLAFFAWCKADLDFGRYVEKRGYPRNLARGHLLVRFLGILGLVIYSAVSMFSAEGRLILLILHGSMILVAAYYAVYSVRQFQRLTPPAAGAG